MADRSALFEQFSNMKLDGSSNVAAYSEELLFLADCLAPDVDELALKRRFVAGLPSSFQLFSNYYHQDERLVGVSFAELVLNAVEFAHQQQQQ